MFSIASKLIYFLVILMTRVKTLAMTIYNLSVPMSKVTSEKYTKKNKTTVTLLNKWEITQQFLKNCFLCKLCRLIFKMFTSEMQQFTQ